MTANPFDRATGRILREQTACPHCARQCTWYSTAEALTAICPEHSTVCILRVSRQQTPKKEPSALSHTAGGLLEISLGLAVAFSTAFVVYAILGYSLSYRYLPWFNH